MNETDLRKENDAQMNMSAEKRAKMLLDRAGDTVSEHDANGRFLYVSAAGAALLGQDIKELLGQDLSDWIHPDDRAQINLSEITAISASEGVKRIVYRLRSSDGIYKRVESTISTGDNATIVMVTRELDNRPCVNARQKLCTHERVSELNAQLESVIESPKHKSIVLIDPDGKILIANQRYKDMLKLISGEPFESGMSIYDLIVDEQTMVRMKEGINRALEGEWYITNNIVSLDGNDQHFELSFNPVFGEEGKPTGVTLFIQNVTSQYELEAELRKNVEQYTMLLNGIDEGIGITNEKEDFVYVNPAGARIFGMTTEEISGRNLLDFLPDELQKKTILDQTALRRQDLTTSYEHEFIRTDGERRTLLVSASPQRQPDGSLQTFGVFRDITDIRRAERELENIGKRFHTLFENANDAICIIDAETDQFVEVNSLFCRWLGVSRDQLLSMSPVDTLSQSTLDAFSKYKEDVYTHGSAVFEVDLIGDGGQEIPVEMNSNLFELDGRMVVLVVARDLTERHQAQQALQESEQRFRSMIENSPSAICIIDENGDFEYINPAYSELSEYDKDELIGENFMVVMPGTDKANLMEMFARNLNDPSLRRDQWGLVTRNGKLKTILADVATITGVDGRPKAVAFLVDITERLREEEHIRFQSQLLNAVQQAVVATDLRGRIIYWNHYAEELFGWKADEVTGKILPRLQPKSAQRGKTFDITRQLKPGQAWSGEIELQRNDGRALPILATTSPIYDRGGNLIGTLGVASDITEWKKYEQELELARELAEQASAAKGTFLTNMSHEIRTPMNSILGFTELLADAITDSRQREHLEAIKVSANSLMLLINDILDLSRIEAGRMTIRPEPVAFENLLRDLRNTFTRNAQEKQLMFVVETTSDLPDAAMLDEIRLRQVLINVVGNAVKFTDNGSVEVVFDAERVDEPDRFNLHIEVRDTGPGIPEYARNQVFSEFVQVEDQERRKYGGTGLGLAITYRLVDMMNGRIWFDSELKRGTTFHIELHDVEVVSQMVETGRITEDVPEIKFSQATILLCEDEVLNRKLIRDYLSDQPLTIEEAENGREALKFAGQQLPDLILLDLRMPEMNGYELMKHLKNNPVLKDVPVITISASLLEQEEKRALDAGAERFLRKPFTRSELIENMRQFLPHIERKQTVEKSSAQVKQESQHLKLVELPETSPQQLLHEIDRFGEDFESEWKKLRRFFSQKNARKQVDKLNALAEQTQIPLLKAYALHAAQYLENLQLEKFLDQIDKYPEIFEQLRSTLQQKIESDQQ